MYLHTPKHHGRRARKPCFDTLEQRLALAGTDITGTWQGTLSQPGAAYIYQMHLVIRKTTVLKMSHPVSRVRGPLQ